VCVFYLYFILSLQCGEMKRRSALRDLRNRGDDKEAAAAATTKRAERKNKRNQGSSLSPRKSLQQQQHDDELQMGGVFCLFLCVKY
jgi:hypothetical protein